VAHGRLGALLYRGIHLWDIAAAGLILNEAGGRLQANRRSGERWDMVAAVPGVREELMRVVGELFNEPGGPPTAIESDEGKIRG
jgi:fructose-1,6-bisphosphatase/inositol monophosphatase family enzyme